MCDQRPYLHYSRLADSRAIRLTRATRNAYSTGLVMHVTDSRRAQLLSFEILSTADGATSTWILPLVRSQGEEVRRCRHAY